MKQTKKSTSSWKETNLFKKTKKGKAFLGLLVVDALRPDKYVYLNFGGK